MGFYCRGSLLSNDAAVKSAAQFGGVHSSRPLCIGEKARLRQDHCMIPIGGTCADIAVSHYYGWQVETSVTFRGFLLLGLFFREN